MKDRMDEGWVTDEELAAWLDLVKGHIPKVESSKPAGLPEPADPPGATGTASPIIWSSAPRSFGMGHPRSRRMRVPGFHAFLLCATASLIAFFFGIWITGRASQPKLGPGGDDPVFAHAGSVRLIVPGALEGQSITGAASGLPDNRRDLIPVYSTADKTAGSSMISLGYDGEPAPLSPELSSSATSQSPDVHAVSPAQAVTLARVTGEAKTSDVPLPPSRAGSDIAARHDAPFVQPRHASGSYGHRPAYFAWHRVRSFYPMGSFARLSASDHGR